jgi:hypothetical protein
MIIRTIQFNFIYMLIQQPKVYLEKQHMTYIINKKHFKRKQ